MIFFRGNRGKPEMMTRPGLPFDHDKYTHISLREYSAGMETQVDGDWSIFEPWSIKMVQQAADDGRLYVEDKNGAPIFLVDLAAEMDPEDADLIWGMFYVPLGESVERIFTLIDGELAVVDPDGNPVLPPWPQKQTDH
jgi:hypothetical protein